MNNLKVLFINNSSFNENINVLKDNFELNAFFNSRRTWEITEWGLENGGIPVNEREVKKFKKKPWAIVLYLYMFSNQEPSLNCYHVYNSILSSPSLISERLL